MTEETILAKEQCAVGGIKGVNFVSTLFTYLYKKNNSVCDVLTLPLYTLLFVEMVIPGVSYYCIWSKPFFSVAIFMEGVLN